MQPISSHSPAPRSFPARGTAALAVLAAVGGALEAQQIPNANESRSGGWGAAEFGRSVAVGYFTPGIELDAVVLDVRTPGLLIAPENYLTRIDLPVLANDIATRPAPAGSGASDTLLSVGPGGLVESTWDPPSASWTPTILESSAWVGARRLRVANLDGGAGELDAVALGAADDVVLVLHGTTSGFVSPVSFTTGFPVYDLELVDWDGDGDEEIAALTDWGVELYQGDGTPITGLEVSYSTLIATSVADTDPEGVTTDRLALVIDDPVTPGREWLVLWTPAGIEGPDLIGDGAGVRHAQTADWDGDGNEDLLLLTSTVHGPTVYFNQRAQAAYTFDTTLFAQTLVESANDPAWNQASVGLGDFDHDGDVDALVPVQGEWEGGAIPIGEDPGFSEIQVVRNATTDESAYFGDIDLARKVYYPAKEPAPDNRLELIYFSPTETIDYEAATQELALEYSAWELGELGDSLGTTPIFEGSVSLDTPTVMVATWLGITVPDFADVFVLLIRQVVRDSTTGEIVALAPAWTETYSQDDDCFANIGLLPQIMLLTPSKSYPDPSLGNGTMGGGVGMGPNLPPSGDGDTPDPDESMP